jgi:hypothetical protein
MLAKIPRARETSMGNPTSGTLHLSTGLAVDRCNPSFMWSDDSRYLAVPRWRYGLGIQLRQQILVIDTVERIVYASRPLAWWLQPKSFSGGLLVIDGEPTRQQPKCIQIGIPGDLCTFRRVEADWPMDRAFEAVSRTTRCS